MTQLTEADVRELLPQLERLARAFARRVGRRQKLARTGKRLDFRRTFRWSVSRGGVLFRLAWHRRQPRQIDLLALCDLSHSVATASTFFLSLLSAARFAFRRCRFYGFVDEPVEVDFISGVWYPSGKIDLSARSDYGRTFCHLSNRPEAFSRNTLLLILGDGRTNRRPAERSSFRKIARQCRAVVWVNPEPVERWNTGDSVIRAYASDCDLLLQAATPRELMGALEFAVRRYQ